MRVVGAVVIPAGAPLFDSSTVRVKLLDVTMADAPSRVLAEVAIANQRRVTTAEQRVPFTLRVTIPPGWNGDLHVAAHVDLDGDAKVSHGDFISTMSYPVSPLGEEGYLVRVWRTE
jgi:uncharacterized lipoprotein YbaY